MGAAGAPSYDTIVTHSSCASAQYPIHTDILGKRFLIKTNPGM